MLTMPGVTLAAIALVSPDVVGADPELPVLSPGSVVGSSAVPEPVDGVDELVSRAAVTPEAIPTRNRPASAPAKARRPRRG